MDSLADSELKSAKQPCERESSLAGLRAFHREDEGRGAQLVASFVGLGHIYRRFQAAHDPVDPRS